MENKDMENKIPKVYDPQQVEQKWYDYWMKNDYFKPNKNNANNSDYFCIVMPPPNVTGQLHIGHALDMTWQDILTRYKRQQGFESAWIPGTDHAGIATQRKVRDALKEQGIDMHEIGREAFLKKVWEWKDEYRNRITNQIKMLGSSCDWSQERFTMDEGYSKAVREAFVTLYEKDLIYRGDYIINWCPECGTTLSDIEVEHQEKGGKLWHFAYPLADEEGEIIVATTRPETILGDVAVAVNPNDERYQKLIGKECILPIIGRRLPIITDEHVEQEFGTGAVKVTPAHDPNDFEIGLRHDLLRINVMNKDATMNEEAGPYAGMERYECRQAIINDLKDQGFLRSIEEHGHAVGQCYRCDTVIEPMLMRQWFVDMKPLSKKPILAAKDKDVTFVPERFKKIYLHWLENIRDWCISRQIWWGHRIPAWYCTCGEIIVSLDDPDKCPKCQGNDLTQETDVLDTWFSSGLWPFAVQGWPETNLAELSYYRTSTLVTGYDILFFWVVRMLVMGLEFTGEVPFDDVLLHGLVRDSQGRKMSKSLGNGVDPLEVIEHFGADALRFTLVTGNTPGNDLRFHPERLEASRNFNNKIWNATRFILMNLDGFQWEEIDLETNLSIADKWILSRYNSLVGEVTRVMDKYEFGEAARMLYDFMWSEFCDWYIEMVKPRLYGDDELEQKASKSVLTYVYSNTLRLLHPFMPFITEELWQALPHQGESIMLGDWPEIAEEQIDENSVNTMENIMAAIRAIRNVRQEADVKANRKVTAIFATESAKHQEMFETNSLYISSLAGIEELKIIAANDYSPDKQAMTAVITGATIYLPLAGLVDIDIEISRLEKDEQDLLSEVARAKGKLENKNFVEKAPEKVVEQERLKLEDYRNKLSAVKERIASLQQLRE